MYMNLALLLLLLSTAIVTVNGVCQQAIGALPPEKNYRIRVKQPRSSCENSIQYSGYIDNLATNEHIYFLFVQSRFAPKTDPVILMLHGEIGCSSVANSWFETGLCLVNQTGGVETNPYSFNHVANLLYIDQPNDVGFSHSEGKTGSSTSGQVTDDIYDFLQFFFTEFSEFAHNQFHISSNGYASHIVPSLATRILRENRYANENDKIFIPLQSIIMGNGLVDTREQDLSYADYACDNDNKEYKPIYNKFDCQQSFVYRRRCQYLQDQCHRYPFGDSCAPASLYCKQSQSNLFAKTHLHPYDIRKHCNGGGNLCFPEIARIEDHVNRQSFRTEYGIDSQVTRFHACNPYVHQRFVASKDHLGNVMNDIEKVLATPVRVLVYAGDMNWEYNWHGQRFWLSNLDWHGQADFNKARERPWISYVSGSKAGVVKALNNIAFVKVSDAGYYTIHDQSANMIDLYSRWLLNISLFYSN